MMSSADITYHGLVNQGATCYLNSVLQVLFMTEDFREAVKRHCDNSGPELIDLDLNSLFDDLQRYAAYTFKITKKLGIDNVYEQRDAAEYFEKILGLTSREASQIFHGQQTQKTICSTCWTETGSDTPFWNLTLALVNFCWGDYSVVAGIEEYFRDSYFSGENQMYCDACEAKCDATMKCEIKAHPEVLMLLLKRFEFDYRYMTYVKINCSVNVPRTLQIPENQTYELYAVVDHFGDLRSGHYNSRIKPQDSERWHVFNDNNVSMLDYQPFQVDSSERSSSAYLLFYRKKKVHAADTCTQDPRKMSSPGDVLPATTDVNSEPFKAEERRAREKDERAAYAEQTIHRNEKTEIMDKVAVGSSGVGLASEDQDKSNHQDCEKYKNYLSYSAEKLRDEVKMMTDDEEDKRGDAQADNQTVRRGSSSGETQPEESVDDPNDDSVRTEDGRHSRPQEGLGGEDMHNTKQKQAVSNVHHQQVSVDMQTDEEIMAMGVNRDNEGIASTKYLDKEEERRDDEGLDHVRQSNYEDQEGTQKASQDDLKTVSMEKQEDGEGMQTEDEERKAKKGKLDVDEIQGKGVGKSKQSMPEDDQMFKQSHKQLREERDQRARDDEHAQKKGASERREQDQKGRSEHVTMQKEVGAVKQARGVHAADTCTQDHGEMSSPGDVLPATTDVYSDPFKAEERRAREKDESVKLLTRQNLDVDDIQGKGVGKGKQSRPEDDQKFESRFYQSHEQPREQERDVKGDKQPKRRDDEHAQIKGASERREQDQQGRSEHITTQKEVGAVKQARGGNEHIQRRADSSVRHAGSAGSSRVRENRGDGRVKESEPPKPMTGLSEDTMEGKHSSKHSKTYKGKIIEEETTHSGVKKITKTQNIRIKTVEDSSRGSVKSLVEYDDESAEIVSEPKTDTTVTLSDGVYDLQLNNSPRKCRKEKNETESTHGKVKRKRKHTQCFYFCRKRRTSESD